MAKYKKLSLITAASLCLLLAFTNPGIKRYKEFQGDEDISVKREQNWLLYSIYKDYDGKRYLGILMNFFEITENHKSDEKGPNVIISPDAYKQTETVQDAVTDSSPIKEKPLQSGTKEDRFLDINFDEPAPIKKASKKGE